MPVGDAPADARMSPAGRSAVAARDRPLWMSLEPIVAAGRPDGAPIRVLDCGGGSGSLAVPLARRGAHVTVLDASADALATLARRAHDAGVGDSIRGVQGDIEEAAALLASSDGARPAGGIDLVMAHGVLDAVADPARVVIELARALRPGAALSIALANPAAAVLARAVAGDIDGALRLARRERDDVASLDPASLRAACVDAGLVVDVERGVGVVADLIPGSAQSQPGAIGAVAELDLVLGERDPYRAIAARIHVIARKPG